MSLIKIRLRTINSTTVSPCVLRGLNFGSCEKVSFQDKAKRSFFHHFDTKYIMRQHRITKPQPYINVNTESCKYYYLNELWIAPCNQTRASIVSKLPKLSAPSRSSSSWHPSYNFPVVSTSFAVTSRL